MSYRNEAVTKTNKMQDYINSIIATGLANGTTLEEMMSNPALAAKAYLNSQLSAIDNAGNELLKTV
mgnify:CR=1 FL=1